MRSLAAADSQQSCTFLAALSLIIPCSFQHNSLIASVENLAGKCMSCRGLLSLGACSNCAKTHLSLLFRSNSQLGQTETGSPKTASTTTQFPLAIPMGQEPHNGPDFQAIVGFCLRRLGRETSL